jgi:hypothetical protein
MIINIYNHYWFLLYLPPFSGEKGGAKTPAHQTLPLAPSPPVVRMPLQYYFLFFITKKTSKLVCFVFVF